MKKFIILFFVFCLLLINIMPGEIFAGGEVQDELPAEEESIADDTDGSLGGLFKKINNSIINPLVSVTFSLGLLVFLWGLVTYLAKAGDAEGQKGARGLMLYGVIILFVMASVWGLVSLIQGTFGMGSGSTRTITPQFKKN